MSLLTASDKVVALGGGCGGSGIQLAVSNAQNVLGTDPGTALNAGVLFVGQIALVGGQTEADETIFYRYFVHCKPTVIAPSEYLEAILYRAA